MMKSGIDQQALTDQFASAMSDALRQGRAAAKTPRKK